MRRHKVLTGVGVILALAALGNLGERGDTKPAAAASPSPSVTSPAAQVMPKVVGQRLDQALADAKKVGVTLTYKHGAQEGYLIEGDHHDQWTVVTSSVPAGRTVKAGQSADVGVLFPDDAKWYLTHPTMPNVVGQDTSTFSSSTGPFGGTSPGHIMQLCARGTEAWTDTDPDYPTPYGPNTPMLPAELAQVKGLKQCSSGGKVVATYPAAGQPVRPGRYLYMVVKGTGEKEPVSDGSAGGTSGSWGGSGGGGSIDWPNHLPGGRHHSKWHW